MNPSNIEMMGAALFAVAVLHTIATMAFERLAHARPMHAGLWHLLGEMEVVFGFWALVLVVVMFALGGATVATQYIDCAESIMFGDGATITESSGNAFDAFAELRTLAT